MWAPKLNIHPRKNVFTCSISRFLPGLFSLKLKANSSLYAPLTGVTEEQLDEIVNIHYKGVFFLTQKVLPFMNDGGVIINHIYKQAAPQKACLMRPGFTTRESKRPAKKG